ncbi:MAG: hypothetical protein CL920_15615 [Deltaproteobacteria bacterium]|nr:hypothetical protein [Deltaproteobacteria bacterium]
MDPAQKGWPTIASSSPSENPQHKKERKQRLSIQKRTLSTKQRGTSEKRSPFSQTEWTITLCEKPLSCLKSQTKGLFFTNCLNVNCSLWYLFVQSRSKVLIRFIFYPNDALSPMLGHCPFFASPFSRW